MLDLEKSKANLIVHSTSPFNAEPPLARLRSKFITSHSDFYVRGHGRILRLDASQHKITVEGNVKN
ncbi:hypothetical protein [Tardiphaga sp.]|uniref:hypothetical protein n=1 Tax=Tardiphaga sp. TaxID=1926292 RepID=UPI00352A94E3